MPRISNVTRATCSVELGSAPGREVGLDRVHDQGGDRGHVLLARLPGTLGVQRGREPFSGLVRPVVVPVVVVSRSTGDGSRR